MEWLELLYMASGNAQWYSQFGKQFLPIKLSMLLPHDTEGPLLATCPRGLKSYVHTKLVHKCIAALFLVVKN